jgi:hypothetical protein
VAAAGVGHAAEERLVEVGPQAEGRGDDAPLPPGRALPHDLAVVRDAAVGEAVGQEEAAPHGLGREVLGDLLAATEPAAVQVRRFSRLDARHEPRPGLRGASGAWTSAPRKRRLRAPARISRRSARRANVRSSGATQSMTGIDEAIRRNEAA